MLLLGFLVISAGRATEPQAQPHPTSVAGVSPESAQKLHAAFEQLYNLDFAGGRELFRQVVAAEPQSASARAFLASALLYEILAHQGTLQSQLFVITNEFLHQSRLPPDPELKRQFLAVAEQARHIANERLERNPADVDGLFALGLTYGNLADFAAGVEARYIYGLREGEKAYEQHQKLRQLHPEIQDTGVILGVHDYVLGSLPRMQRLFLFFLGAGGDRQRGLGYLAEAAERGEFLRAYARVLLAVACIREGQLDRAAQLLERLHADFPRNPLFLSELARIHEKQGHYQQAAQICRELAAELIAHPHNPRILGPEDAWLELGRVEAAAGNRDAALEALRKAEQVSGADKKILAWALLEQGRILDEKGEREKALADYEKVMRLPADPETIKLASFYHRSPYHAGARP